MERVRSVKTPCRCGLNAIDGFIPPYNCTCPPSKFQYEERTICDMIGKLIQYGGLSDKQFAFMAVCWIRWHTVRNMRRKKLLKWKRRRIALKVVSPSKERSFR